MQTIPRSNTNIALAIFIVATIIGIVGFGVFEYENNLGSGAGQDAVYKSGYNAGYNNATLRWQASAIAAEKSYVGLLQEALDKMADVSQNKSLRVGAAGFDVLASIFRSAGRSSDVSVQRQMLCNQTDAQDFNRTATLTNHPNITSTYQSVCTVYPILASDFTNPVDPATLQKLSSDFTDLAFNLMKLDNTISEDP